MHFVEATLYLRISLDQAGLGLGMERQEEACRELCDRMGWTVTNVFTDNSVSATKKKKRPAFEALIDSKPKRIVMWSVDRLVRKGPDLERLIELDIPVHSVAAGPMDLATASGRLNARLLTSVATFEGEIKSERQQAAALQRAKAGKPWWPRRPFGYEMDGTLRQAEAKALVKAYEGLLSGAPLSTLASNLNEAGLTTNLNNQWTGMTLRAVLLNARNAGIKVYKGEEIGPATWEPVVPEETYRAACYLLNADSRKSGGGGPRKHLLTGVALCGVCGGTLRVGYRGRKGEPGSYAIYLCKSNVHVTMRVEWLDAYVEQLILNLLASPKGGAFWNHSDGSGSNEELVREGATIRARLDELADAFADGEITRGQLQKGSERLRERLAEVETAFARGRIIEGPGGARSAADAIEEWSSYAVDKQRAFIEALTERVVINKRPKGTRKVREGDIVVKWRHAE